MFRPGGLFVGRLVVFQLADWEVIGAIFCIRVGGLRGGGILAWGGSSGEGYELISGEGSFWTMGGLNSG